MGLDFGFGVDGGFKIDGGLGYELGGEGLRAESGVDLEDVTGMDSGRSWELQSRQRC